MYVGCDVPERKGLHTEHLVCQERFTTRFLFCFVSFNWKRLSVAEG